MSEEDAEQYMKSFGSFEDMLQWQRDMDAKAAESLQYLDDAQREIAPGSFVHSFEHGVDIWGYIPTLTESLAAEFMFINDNELVSDGYDLDGFIENYLRRESQGFLHGVFFSPLTHGGVDIGSKHITMMDRTATLAEVFEAADELGSMEDLARYSGPKATAKWHEEFLEMIEEVKDDIEKMRDDLNPDDEEEGA